MRQGLTTKYGANFTSTTLLQFSTSNLQLRICALHELQHVLQELLELQLLVAREWLPRLQSHGTQEASTEDTCRDILVSDDACHSCLPVLP